SLLAAIHQSSQAWQILSDQTSASSVEHDCGQISPRLDPDQGSSKPERHANRRRYSHQGDDCGACNSSSGNRAIPPDSMVTCTRLTAADTSTPTFTPCSCRITPLSFRSCTPATPPAIAPPAPIAP